MRRDQLRKGGPREQRVGSRQKADERVAVLAEVLGGGRSRGCVAAFPGTNVRQVEVPEFPPRRRRGGVHRTAICR